MVFFIAGMVVVRRAERPSRSGGVLIDGLDKLVGGDVDAEVDDVHVGGL